ncbi:MAG TPA: Gfo/Idh/MocA family oxidoreductase [Opitutaceae bacterium]|nr:Gfo/Idh/MocA family oxidoreductase [Opitutaceae bacterium]
MRIRLVILFLTAAVACVRSQESAPPVRLAIIGLVHDHVTLMLPELAGRQDVHLVGIVEPNQEAVAHYAQRFHLDRALFFPSIEALVAKTKVDAVATFTSTFDHRRVVETCAPLGIDVMMEKPLAVSMDHARAISAAASKGGIQVIVNYETTWYPSNQVAYDVVHARHAIGDLRKIVVRDGHQGPIAIGVSPFFGAWLMDPVLDGGGALMDFGCYGVDLATWMMEGARPTSVLAVTQNFQPDAYPRVEDEATIVLTYPRTQAIIQASWNWPYGRKDMDIYGEMGALRLPNRDTLFMRTGDGPEVRVATPALADAGRDALSYLVAVVRGKVRPSGLSSLEVNMVVSEVLDAARESARTGRRIDLGGDPPR